MLLLAKYVVVVVCRCGAVLWSMRCSLLVGSFVRSFSYSVWCSWWFIIIENCWDLWEISKLLSQSMRTEIEFNRNILLYEIYVVFCLVFGVSREMRKWEIWGFGGQCRKLFIKIDKISCLTKKVFEKMHNIFIKQAYLMCKRYKSLKMD